MGKTSERVPDLREFVKENDQRLYTFCVYMLHRAADPDELALDVFREFGDSYRKTAASKETPWGALEMRIRLYQIAWERVRDALLAADAVWVPGRDTRVHKAFDEDLIRTWRKSRTATDAIVPAALERLTKVDLDFRAPVVLRDVLGFEDEEVVRILGLRWGVYRHRLHRGRLECREGLRGRPFTAESGPTTISP